MEKKYDFRSLSQMKKQRLRNRSVRMSGPGVLLLMKNMNMTDYIRKHAAGIKEIFIPIPVFPMAKKLHGMLPEKQKRMNWIIMYQRSIT